ncbi:MAG: helix-turn-helix domain-containing protein [Pirellulales bacterium]|jgi:transcriptional regulator with XRE-family HTH domain|nr:helix-turn-helix domain-containing protein [Pirellulales bacterium]HJN66272.1 helix-turn-helix domain-containing protein [Pirellulales bacterium]|tara:strand:+ start:594 stop:1118 length:525 start_codon:yes stop_codon:yes gene_type:complete
MGTLPQNRNPSVDHRTISPHPAGLDRPLHRIREIRAQHDVSLRSLARKMHVPVREIRAQEDPTCDLPLTAVYRWQKALNVPAAEILVEPDDRLSTPVNIRARLLRMMKTVVTILEKDQPERTRNLLENLRTDILAVMPEVAHIDHWHGSGGPKGSDDIAAAVLRQISDELLRDP